MPDQPQLSTDIQAIALRRAKRLRSTFDRCYPTSLALACDLAAAGHPACVIQLYGLRTDAPAADERWKRFPQSSWTHYVVQTGDCVIDLTRRQFFPDCEPVHVDLFDRVKEEWVFHYHAGGNNAS